MIKRFCALAVVLSAVAASAGDFTLHTFKKIKLSEHFWSEGASYGDFNKDGKMDVVSGPFWWEGPDFKTKHEYYPATKTFTLKKDDGTEVKIPGYEGALGKKNAYTDDNFFAFTYDFNGDQWTDILIIGFPSKPTWWYENPKGAGGSWKRHTVTEMTANESPTFGDLTGDGKPELIFQTALKEGTNSVSYFGYATPDWSNPTAKWTFHKISTPGKWHHFNHGFGWGDVNGDGKADILEKDGWWEQPASLAGDPAWKQHKVAFAPGTGGAQMYVYDINGDGANDVITSLAAHGYGLAWYEQLKEKKDSEIQFKQHIIMNKEPKENRYGVRFSQLHAIDLIDIDGDGLKDIVTGKRFWAHGPTGDADPSSPPVLYWFKHGGDAGFIPHLIDNDSGVGTQVVAGDFTGDKLPDIVVGNKKGTFVFIHEAKKVSAEEWEKAQPKPLTPTTASTQ
jgi:FG-GAP-like repeat